MDEAFKRGIIGQGNGPLFKSTIGQQGRVLAFQRPCDGAAGKSFRVRPKLKAQRAFSLHDRTHLNDADPLPGEIDLFEILMDRLE